METTNSNPDPNPNQSRPRRGGSIKPHQMLRPTPRNRIHVYGLFGPNDSPSGLPNRYWTRVCRCERPTDHLDTFLITNLEFRERLNSALDKAGKEDMGFVEWWGLVMDMVLEETPVDYRKYREWKSVMEKRLEWMDGQLFEGGIRGGGGDAGGN